MNAHADDTRQRLESLIEINQLLMSAVEPDEVLDVILNSAIRLFSAEGCSLALLDETEQKLRFVIMAGSAKAEEFQISLGQGIAGWVAQTGQGVVSNDVAHDQRFYSGIDQDTGFTTQSVICAPLKQRNKIVGVMEALNTIHPQGFTDEDLQLLTTLGSLAGTAIARSEVFSRVRNASAALFEVVQDRYRLVLGTSHAMQEALRLARTVSPTTSTVLLLGESGTGKEVIARSIHQWSQRADHPFIAVNCVALTPELLASELFGHERGAFTGAVAQKKGKFELAQGGTIFLDEIGDLAPDLQTKLLRVLQEREFQRVGGIKDIRVNVRVLAATNRNLHRAVQSGALREDLFYRLNVISLTLPPLRDRREDIPALVDHFIVRYCREVNRPCVGIEPSAMQLLQSYHWPGNVRELQNVIERAVVLSPGPNITERDFPSEIREAVAGAAGSGADVASTLASGRPRLAINESLPLKEAVNEFKRNWIRRALDAAGGNQSQAAATLGVAPSNLSRLLKSLGLR